MKKASYFLLLSSLIFLQSCFEIIEQVSIRNDGSGNFNVVVNLSKSKTKLNSIRKMKTVNGHKVPGADEIKKEIGAIANTVKGTPGITEVKTSVDLDNYIVSLSCNFSQVDDLNAAIKNIAVSKKSKTAIENTYRYDAGNKTFHRMNKFLMKDEYNKLSSADKEIFATANYTGIFRFDGLVSTVSNPGAKLAANKKAVMLKLNLLDILTNKRSIENKINIK